MLYIMARRNYDITGEGKLFKTFLENCRSQYEDQELVSNIEQYIRDVQIWNNQFLYIHHIRSGKFYHKGFRECLGYDLRELTADFFVRNIHEADRSVYFNISKAMLSFVLHNAPYLVPFASTFHVNYRIRQQNGEYIYILRQSTPFIKNSQNEVEAYISLCTNISHISNNTTVKWEIFGPKAETLPMFLEQFMKPPPSLFSEREREILRLLNSGLSSTAIAERLFISLNTVNTHRKSLMRKAGVNKTIDLISYAKENGMI